MRKVVLTVMLCVAALSVAQAALNLELTQGVDQAIPIGISAFAPDITISGNTHVAAVVRNDLNNSGRFKAQPFTKGAPISKLDNILSGSVTPLGGGRYKLRAQLRSVYGSQLLFDKQYLVTAAQLRTAAHYISNDVYQKLTGVPGIFATNLAYVLVTDKRGRRYYTLELSDADGFNPRPLLRSVQPIMSPAWAPDGKHIYYVSFEGYRARIYVQDILTGRRKSISSYHGINGAPAISPDGKQMALVLSSTGDPKIYLMNMQSHKMKQLTHGPSIDTEPSWEPNEKALLFTSNRGGSPQIYKFNINSGKVQRLTFQGNYNARPRVLPDGKGFVMMHRDVDQFGIAKQTDGQTDVLVRAGLDESPSVAPNGQMVIYATQRGKTGVLAMVSIDGRVKLTLPAREGSVQEPAWSPFNG